MTSNIGVKRVETFGEGVGFATKAKKQASEEHTRTMISKALKDTFNPEFLNRLDDIIFFERLASDSLKEIIKIELNLLVKRLESKEYFFSFGATVVSHILDIGYNEKFGARPLKRAIQSEIEDFISEEILKGNVKEGEKYTLNYDKKKEKINLN